MLKRYIAAAVLVMPIMSAYAAGALPTKPPGAPEIDGSYAVLGIALVGGALSILKKRSKK